jgi:UDP-N-acetylmuramate dehydrogenase
MNIQENVPLSKFTSIHVGGPARFFVPVKTMEELRKALSFADDRSLPRFVLGGGSNLLVSDTGFPGVVVKMENRGTSVSESELCAGAGAITRLAVLTGIRGGLTGVEHLAGIPGTVGGAVRGNAGSFGTETKDRLVRVEVLHRTAKGWEAETLPREAIVFSYRTSTFKLDPSYVVCAAVFALDHGDVKSAEKLVAEDLEMRHTRQPYEFPSMGSVFKNPKPGEVHSGSLIEKAGLKGLRVGGAQISEKHGNFIVNRGRATAADILALITEVKKRVRDMSGIALEEEIVLLK